MRGQNENIELSALVQTTNVNSTQLRSPPFRAGPFPSASESATCKDPLRGKDALLVAAGPGAISYLKMMNFVLEMMIFIKSDRFRRRVERFCQQ